MKKIFAIAMVFCICFCLTVPVFADEQSNNSTDYDWEHTDWETFEWRDLDAEVYESLADWLETDADLETAILVTTTTGDGWIAELWARVLAVRLQKEPYQFLRIVAQKDEAVRSHVAADIGYFGFYSEEEVEQCFHSLVLPNALTKAEQALLDAIIAKTEEAWNMDIPNPKTSDPVGAVAAAMVLSGLGCCMMLRRKRIITI